MKPAVLYTRAHAGPRDAETTTARPSSSPRCPHPRTGALALLLGCGIRAGDDTAAEASSSGDEAPLGGSSTGSPTLWPHDAYGAFFFDSDLPLDVSGTYFAFPSNLELSPSGLVVTHLRCDGSELREDFPIAFEGDQAHVRPAAGQSHVLWRGAPVAAELVFRPGDSCAELETELVEPASGYGDPWRWRRGALVVTDTCDGTADESWAIDLSAEVGTACPPG